MNTPAFTITGMFSAAVVGKSSFTPDAIPVATSRPTAAVRMAVDPFQKKFQSFGKINIDYSRPKKLASYKRSGYPVTLDFPNSAAQAGHYSVSNCDKPGGAGKILQKYDEYCAKGIMQVYKRSAVPYGVYTTKCTEGTVKLQAFDKRVFNRTMAFRQSQKPINVRLAERYAARKACFTMANGCSREEDQFKNMPMSCATYLAGRAEALGTCYRVVTPSTVAEDYMADGVRAQLRKKAHPYGVYRVGVCEDGHAKGDADMIRVTSLASEFRAGQQSPSAITAQQYESTRTAIKLFTHNCHHEESQVCEYPAVAAALSSY